MQFPEVFGCTSVDKVEQGTWEFIRRHKKEEEEKIL